MTFGIPPSLGSPSGFTTLNNFNSNNTPYNIPTSLGAY